MPQSLVKNYIHIVFSTKHRQKLILPQYEMELYAYLGGICNNLESPVLKVGGYQDHVHILCMLSRKIALMTLVQKVKANSSKWMKTKDVLLREFQWQNGYGAFSVNDAKIDNLVRYIGDQHEHHSNESFKEEYRRYLERYNVEYDERYVWD